MLRARTPLCWKKHFQREKNKRGQGRITGTYIFTYLKTYLTCQIMHYPSFHLLLPSWVFSIMLIHSLPQRTVCQTVHSAAPHSIPKLLGFVWGLHTAKQMSSVFCQCWTTSHQYFNMFLRLNRAKTYGFLWNPLVRNPSQNHDIFTYFHF